MAATLARISGLDLSQEKDLRIALWHKFYPFEAFLPQGAGNLPKDSKVKADQIRTFNKSRLLALIGLLGGEEIIQIEEAIKVHLGLS